MLQSGVVNRRQLNTSGATVNPHYTPPSTKSQLVYINCVGPIFFKMGLFKQPRGFATENRAELLGLDMHLMKFSTQC